MTSYLRYRQHLAVLDADDIESWITVRGNHIPIKKGQTKEEAVKSFLESKSEPKGLTEQFAKAHNELNKQETLYQQGKTTEYQVNEARNKALKLKGKVQEQSKGTKKIIEFAEKKDNDWSQSGGDYIFNELDDGKVINMEYENDTKAPYAVRLTDVDGEKTYETQNFQTLEEAVNYTKSLEEKHNKNYYEEFSLNLYDKYHDIQRTITISGKDIYEAKANARKEIEKLKDWDDDYFSYELSHDKVYKKNGDVETIQKIKL